MGKAVLVLHDGTYVVGEGIGAEKETHGEVVFNTAMTGYQEALTDPSYKYQILMFTYPLLGNYGIQENASESSRIHAEGLVVRELTEKPSHGKLKGTLDEFLRKHDTPGLHGVDTRFLTRKIRMHGVMNGILKNPFVPAELPELKEKVKKLKSISDLDLVSLVSTKEVKHYDVKGKKTLVLLDCGEKSSIIRALLTRGINIIKVPAKTSPEEIMKFNPNGVVISNGPGNPERADYVIKTTKKLIDEKIPIFGICLGLQIIALACGAKTYKLKFGHRGANQPVLDVKTKKVYITSQNHGFAADADSCRSAGITVTHINLNDKSVEGIKNKGPAMAVQYHPEANPGPWDNYYLFDEFIKLLK